MRRTVLSLVLIALSSAGLGADRDANELQITAQIAHQGDFLTYGYDAVWQIGGRKLIRIDPTDNSVIEYPIAGARGPYRGIATGEGGVWIADTGSDQFSKIDPATGAVLFSVPVTMFNTFATIGVGQGSVFIVDETVGKPALLRLDASSGAELARVPITPSATGVAFAFGSVWVAADYKNLVYRIDPTTLATLAEIPVSDGPQFIGDGFGSMWVVGLGAGGVVNRIDPATNATTLSVGTGGTVGGNITFGAGSVWTTYYGDLPLVQIDPLTGAVQRFPGHGFGDALAFGAGSLWLSGRVISRIVPPAMP